MKISRALLLSLLAPGVVCLLVAVQIAFGLRGFDAPRGGVAAILEVPGLLVGWGALFFLCPLLVWLVLDWWGVSFSGIALKCLGATAVAIAIGAMFGVVGGVGAGGHLGAALGTLLKTSLGSPVTFALLTLMALPGLVLTCIGFLKQGEQAPARPRSSNLEAPAAVKALPPAEPKQQQAPASEVDQPESPPAEPKPRGTLFRKRKRFSNLADLMRDSQKRPRVAGEPWYPEPNYDDSGHELPMDFGEHRDVGGIRFVGGESEPAEPAEAADPGIVAETPAEAETEVDAATSEAGLPTIPELFAGAYDPGALENALDETPQPPAADEDTPTGTPTGTPTEPPEAATPPEPAEIQSSLGRIVGTAPSADEGLMPGVRWATHSGPTERSELDDETAARRLAEQRVHDRLVAEVGRVPADLATDPGADEIFSGVEAEDVALGAVMAKAPTPAESGDSVQTPSVRDSVLEALNGEARSKSSQRYMEKLEACGIFDFMRDDEDDDPKTGAATEEGSGTPEPKAAKPTKRSKKTTGKPSKASKSTASAKGKRAKRGKKATRKTSAVRRPRETPALKKKPAAPVTKVKRAAPARPAPSETPKDQWRTGSWRHGPDGIQASAPSSEPERVTEEVRRGVRRERADPNFTRAAELCMTRGAASPVLLTRRLGVGFSEAKSLVARLLSAGVLGPMTATGSHPATMTRETWDEASR